MARMGLIAMYCSADALIFQEGPGWRKVSAHPTNSAYFRKNLGAMSAGTGGEPKKAKPNTGVSSGMGEGL